MTSARTLRLHQQQQQQQQQQYLTLEQNESDDASDDSEAEAAPTPTTSAEETDADFPPLSSTPEPTSESDADTPAVDLMYLGPWGLCAMRALYLSKMSTNLYIRINEPNPMTATVNMRLVTRAASGYSYCYQRLMRELPATAPNNGLRAESPLSSIPDSELHRRVLATLNTIAGLSEAVHLLWNRPCTVVSEAMTIIRGILRRLEALTDRVECLKSLDAEYQWRMYGEDPRLDPALGGLIFPRGGTCCGNAHSLCEGNPDRPTLEDFSRCADTQEG